MEMDPMKRLTALALAAASLLASAATQAAPVSLITNGSFETLPVALGDGQWTVLSALAGWTADPTSGVELRRNTVGSAQDGVVFAELDTNVGTFGASTFDTSTNSWISQSVATIAGTHYTLSWYYAPRTGEAADTNAIDVLWNGVKLATSNGSGMGANANVWQQYTFDVVGTGQDLLKFAAGGKADAAGGARPHDWRGGAGGRPPRAGGAAPPPGGLAGVALLGLAFSRRRRQD